MISEPEKWTTGNWLERYLFEHRITPKAVARAAGLKDATVYKILREDRTGSIGTWMKIAESLGCTVSELMEPLKLLERFAFLEEPQPEPKKEMYIDGVPISEWIKQ